MSILHARDRQFIVNLVQDCSTPSLRFLLGDCLLPLGWAEIDAVFDEIVLDELLFRATMCGEEL